MRSGPVVAAPRWRRGPDRYSVARVAAVSDRIGAPLPRTADTDATAATRASVAAASDRIVPQTRTADTAAVAATRTAALARTFADHPRTPGAPAPLAPGPGSPSFPGPGASGSVAALLPSENAPGSRTRGDVPARSTSIADVRAGAARRRAAGLPIAGVSSNRIKAYEI